MARQFGDYSPSVPLGVTWEESFTLEDADGNAVDITGYDIVAFLMAAKPGRTAGTGAITPEPVAALTTAGYYNVAPAWDVIEAFTVTSAAGGAFTLRVEADDLWTLSPTNAKTKLFWSIVLVNGSGYMIPVIAGRVALLPATTVVA